MLVTGATGFIAPMWPGNLWRGHDVVALHRRKAQGTDWTWQTIEELENPAVA
jgi:hypothetical protein